MSKRTVKNLKGEQHKRAANLQTKGEMGAELYQQNVVNVTPIFRGIVKMKKKTGTLGELTSIQLII